MKQKFHPVTSCWLAVYLSQRLQTQTRLHNSATTPFLKWVPVQLVTEAGRQKRGDDKVCSAHTVILLQLVGWLSTQMWPENTFETPTNKWRRPVQHEVQVRTTDYAELTGLAAQAVWLTEGQGRVCIWTRGQAWLDGFSAKGWRETAAVGSERRSPVRVAEDDSSFVPSLSPNQFSLASPK